MDLLDVKRCPVCGSPHDTYSGVAMHMVKMGDGAHTHIQGMDQAYEHLAYCDVLVARSHRSGGSPCPGDSELGYS